MSPGSPTPPQQEQAVADAIEIRRRLIADAQRNVDDIVRQVESALRDVPAPPPVPDIPASFAGAWSGLSEVLNDPRTGLPSRALFWDRLQQTIRHFRRHSTPFALLHLRFHGAGEEHIPFISDQLARVLRASDTVTYTGQGGFAVLLAEISSASDGDVVASHIRRRLGGLGDSETGATIRLALGAATPDKDNTDPIRLLFQAHSRMLAEA